MKTNFDFLTNEPKFIGFSEIAVAGEDPDN